MPKGPKGQKRPADVIGAAVKVMRIATGEEVEERPADGKDAAAKELGRKGGEKRAAALDAGQYLGRRGSADHSHTVVQDVAGHVLPHNVQIAAMHRDRHGL